MPDWKIKGYKFRLRESEVLEKHEPAHIHVKTERGEIEFWLVTPNTKVTDEVSIKDEKGHVSKSEKSEIAKIVRKRRDEFLNEWNSIKERKGKQVEKESSSSKNKKAKEKNLSSDLNLNLNLDLKKQNLIQLETQESLLLQENENSLSLSSSQRNEQRNVSASASTSLSLLEATAEVASIVLVVAFIFMGIPNYHYQHNFHR